MYSLCHGEKLLLQVKLHQYLIYNFFLLPFVGLKLQNYSWLLGENSGSERERGKTE